ncbi:Alpha-tocopherol transfer protein [Liparis tanakae]|uniref:Alpha-tocopherol transfer protein n=1 Tax=Liparis tanakae TaxID=230148 RepID=A0A4Z2F7H3_9TELE|nr:Alpha-tocopherol transfer protein [Liparis tanakae]
MDAAQLRELPDDAPPLRPHVRVLRLRALRELPAGTSFSTAFLLRFLRARDFDQELSLKWNPKDWTAFQVFRVSLMTSEIIAMETETQRRGLKVIFDLQGWSLGHALQINPSLARKISSVLSDSFPLKVRGIHLVNEPLFFWPVFSMLRPFLPEKIKQRIHMHGADFQDTLSDFFSPPVLPPEYGGEGPSIEEACRGWTNQLLQSETLLQQIAAHPTGDIAVSPEDEDRETL